MRLFNMRSDNFEDVGHWKRRSALGLTYDSEECVLEGGVNQGKCVCAAFAGGWRRVGAACLPNPAPMAPSGNFCDAGGSLCSVFIFDDQPFADRRVHPPVVGAFNMDTRVLHT